MTIKVYFYFFEQDFAKLVDAYNAKLDELYVLPKEIPLNFIMLNCQTINKTLYDMIHDLKMDIINYFIKENRENNRE